MSEVKIKLAAGTNVGLIRQNNEDNFVVCSDLSTSEWLIPQAGDYADLGAFGSLLVVADGMGGANAGEVASAIAVETIQEKFTADNLKDVVTDDKSAQEFMKDVVKQADLNILQRSKEDSSTQGMGTTIVMTWILGDKAYVCWCGDSRCYVLNKRNGLIQLSKDHSYVQELVDKGELSAELMHDHPLSNVITRCLGDSDNRANPETRIYQLHDGDIIMLCSDGLCGLCHDSEILDVMIKFHDDPMECKNELISAALSAGGYDNVTIAIANIQTDEEPEEPAEEKEEEKKDEEKNDEEEVNEEELSTTIRTEVIGRRSHKKLYVTLILLLILIGAGAYIWLAEDCEPLRQTIVANVAPYWDKLISYFK
jgi:protein phosphatase